MVGVWGLGGLPADLAREGERCAVQVPAVARPEHDHVGSAGAAAVAPLEQRKLRGQVRGVLEGVERHWRSTRKLALPRAPHCGPPARWRGVATRALLLAAAVLTLAGAAPAQVAPQPGTPYPDTLDRRRLRHVAIAQGAYVAGGMGLLYANWYADRARVPFHFYRDGRGYLQVDKTGHAFGAYVYSTVGYRSLRRAGLRKGPALWWGGGLGMYLQTPIELMDGLHEGWGFSWADMGANAVGTALAVAQEALLDRQVVRMKFSFWRSPLAREANGYLGDGFGESLLLDYNGHTYWLSVPITGEARRGPRDRRRLSPKPGVPPWLNVAVGYGAGGMLGEFENRGFYRGEALPRVDRHRQFYLSLDVDWERVPTRSPLLRGVLRGLNFVKLPFPTLEVNTLGEVRGHWLYF